MDTTSDLWVEWRARPEVADLMSPCGNEGARKIVRLVWPCRPYKLSIAASHPYEPSVVAPRNVVYSSIYKGEYMCIYL
jgi:hypothetical protein